jgi:hypothetical protein
MPGADGLLIPLLASGLPELAKFPHWPGRGSTKIKEDND